MLAPPEKIRKMWCSLVRFGGYFDQSVLKNSLKIILLYIFLYSFYWENIAINDVTTVWENLFIKIRHKTPGSKTQIIGNIYRKPNELLHDFHKFQDEFDETLERLRVNRIPVYLCGDFNIDLLKLNVKDHYNTFFNNLIAAGYFPRISLPTRITNHSATLLDNIYSTELDSNESGILVNNISDHQMIYTYNTTQRKNTSTSSKKNYRG